MVSVKSLLLVGAVFFTTAFSSAIEPRAHYGVHVKAYKNVDCMGHTISRDKIDADKHDLCHQFGRLFMGHRKFRSFEYDWGKTNVDGEKHDSCEIQVWSDEQCEGKMLQLVVNANDDKDTKKCLTVGRNDVRGEGALSLKVVCGKKKAIPDA